MGIYKFHFHGESNMNVSLTGDGVSDGVTSVRLSHVYRGTSTTVLHFVSHVIGARYTTLSRSRESWELVVLSSTRICECLWWGCRDPYRLIPFLEVQSFGYDSRTFPCPSSGKVPGYSLLFMLSIANPTTSA
jgi:hypothetical protein